MRTDGTREPKLRPRALGMGLVALDLVFTADKPAHPRTYVGGTCGNVLTVLSYLGWESTPLSRLGCDKAAERVLQDLRRWRVSTGFVSRQPDGSTPVIVQRIRRLASGQTRHSFSWRCPSCGAYLPGYKPVLASAVEQMALKVGPADVFFLDRLSRGTLLLAQICKRRGAVVVFEPSGIGDPQLFREAWGIAHIVKYSHERLHDLAELDLPTQERSSALLEIETVGADGLRFRSHLPRARTEGWVSIDAFPLAQPRDTSGAGDWCTAGILDVLARNGAAGLKSISMATLEKAMRYGQALATWNCRFEGARGGMYEATRATFAAAIKQILKGSSTGEEAEQRRRADSRDAIQDVCSVCTETLGSHPQKKASKPRRMAS